jgi:ATP-dependent Zn protease
LVLPKDPRAVAAIHEAGHAVVSAVLRTGVMRGDIHRTDDGREGLTKYSHFAGMFQGSQAVMERRGATTLGGMAAVWIASGKQEQHRLSPGDMLPGWTFVYEIVGMDPTETETKACWDGLYGRAVSILEANWRAVEAVAAVLVRQGQIDRKQILAITQA